MFWRFGGYANISTLDSILDKQDLTLEELLDESDLIQELKQQNSKLIEFLRNEAALKKLLEYVVAEKIQKDDKQATDTVSFFARAGARSSSKSKADSDDAEHDKKEEEARRKKYAYVACEVLSSDVWSITEALLEKPDHLRTFWQYVYREAPLDPLQAGYFTKVNENLLDKKTEDMLAIFKSLDGVVPAMLQHVDCPMTMDLLLKIVSLEKSEGGAGIVAWLQTQSLIPSLLGFLSSDQSPATQTSAGDFLKAIITISANATTQDQSVIGPNELTRELVSKDRIDQLIQEMLRGGNALTVGVGIVIEVIRKNNSDYDIDAHTDPLPRSSDPIYLGTLLRCFAENISEFMHLIRSPAAKRPDLRAAFGSTVEPLGFDRFKTCELMAELLHCSNMSLLNERGAEEEVRRRDAEREKLRAEGKLLPAPPIVSHEGDAGFSSSVDSHGFHHAEKPDNADDDEFEKVMPDEVNFDDQPSSMIDTISEELGEMDLEDRNEPVKPSPLFSAKPIADDAATNAPAPLSSSDAADKPLPLSPTKEAPASPKDDAAKPAPLFAKKAAEPEDVGGSTATIQPDTVDELANDDSPVVGDLLKMRYVENHVVPTILDFFFRFPWNNFLHNVVYDVVQQVFNGALERGYNRQLALDLFQSITPADDLGLLSLKDITDRILDGQASSDRSQSERNMRLGYMGHLTLIAEEVCKFGVRLGGESPETLVSERIGREAWTTYIDGVLTETRDKDNAVLGGVRPESAMARGMGSLQPTFASTTSSALASAGLGTGLSEEDNLALSEGTVGEPFEGNVTSRFGDDDEDDEDDLGDDSGHQDRSNPFTEDEQDESTATISIPPPLNIVPSRARRQLAARLAQKKRDAAGDPDSADDVAVKVATDLPEPSDIDLGPATERELQEAGLEITGLRSLRSDGGSKFSGLFGSDDSSSDSLDEDDAGRDETLDREEGDFEDEPLTFGRRSRQHQLTPVTTEAKERKPLDDGE